MRTGFRRRGGVVAAVAVVIVAAAVASAGAVVNGAPDGGGHPYVGMAVWFPTGNPADGFELCSGSLVSATVFVTAAHCFPDGAQVLVDMDEHAFADLHNPGFGSSKVGIAHVYPGWGFGTGLANFDRNDVAVVTINEGGFPQPNSRYAHLPSVGFDETLPDKSEVEIVGYGLTDPSNPHTLGTRQAAPSQIIPGGGVTGDEFLKLSSSPDHGGGATCSGDSGGPDLLAGTDTILAISGYGASSTCNAVAYSQRLDTPDALAFITSYLSE